ncbi:urease accessory protein UreE [Natronobeatus ordinarius]|uniref:urease accessory protein UreE n=1 Tax=Natronobeatus ordinarius TaxID=2963433 RepID=UPI0020CCC880|nr:urease accessory protein UreE [Natronobeatus ordinarius]
MRRVDGVLGNVREDSKLAKRREEHEERGTLERVVLAAGERKKSRLRTSTDAGTDLGVLVDRPALEAGDVLLCEDERMVVVAFEPREVLALELPNPSPNALAAAVELGHRVGNQHWDLAVEDGVVYVPLEADRHIVERVVDDDFPDAHHWVERVDAELFLADGGEGELDAGHQHGHGHNHDHDTQHSHGNDTQHSHGNDTQHSHGHGDQPERDHTHHDHGH